MAKVIIQMDNYESFIEYANARSEFDKKVKELNKFKDKYSNIHPNFTDSLKVDDEKGCFMIDLTAMEILLPEQSESFEAKLLSNDVGNKRGVGFGVSCFDDGFYSELYNLFNDNGYINGEFRGSISGNFEGYYAFSAILKNDGLHWNTEFYQYENDGDYENCQGCGEELWSEEDDTNISDIRPGYCFLCEGKI